MRILVVNPNTTAAMTEKIGRAARVVAASGTEIIAVNPPDGPVSIEGYYDEAFSVPGLLSEIAKGEASGVSAHIIACFDDTGLEAARSLASAPVIGIGEAAFHLASLLGHRFAVVTTLSRSIAAIETNLLKYGLASRCAKVRACEVPVLALDDPASNASAQISAEIERAKREDNAEVIVLGCAGDGRPRRAPVGAAWPARGRWRCERRQTGGSPGRTGSQDLQNQGLCRTAAENLSGIPGAV